MNGIPMPDKNDLEIFQARLYKDKQRLHQVVEAAVQIFIDDTGLIPNIDIVSVTQETKAGDHSEAKILITVQI